MIWTRALVCNFSYDMCIETFLLTRACKPRAGIVTSGAMAGAVMTERPPQYEDKVRHEKVQHTLWILNIEYELIFFGSIASFPYIQDRNARSSSWTRRPSLRHRLVSCERPSLASREMFTGGCMAPSLSGLALSTRLRVRVFTSLSPETPILYFLQFIHSRPGQGPCCPRRTAHASTAICRCSIAERIHSCA